MKTLSERQYYKRIVSQNLHPIAPNYHHFAFVEQAMSTRLLEGLDLMRINPTLILDLGSGTGHDATQLRARYPKTQIVQLDLSESMIHAAKYRIHTKAQASLAEPSLPKASLAKVPYDYLCAKVPYDYLCADAEMIPLQANSVDLVFANALLPWLPDSNLIFKEVGRVLKAGGLFLFSSFGPDTFKESNQVLKTMNRRTVDENALLIDMHDIGDQLIQESFESPVMDSSLLTFEYTSPFGLIRDLHRTGWSYAMPSMERAELKAFLGDFKKHYECYQNRQGYYQATLEVIIGHAWCGAKKEEHRTLGLKVLSTR